MQHRINCECSTRKGALERILRVIRIRGFEVNYMQAEDVGDGMQMEFTLSGIRCILNLLQQLEKLHDVVAVGRVEPVNRVLGKSA